MARLVFMFEQEFEGIGESLPYMPLAARRALDAAGTKVSLDAWRAMPIEDRRGLVALGAAASVDVELVRAIAARATPKPVAIAAATEPPKTPAELSVALGEDRPLEASRWEALSPLARYVLWKCTAKPAKLARAYDEIVRAHSPLAHLNEAGEARMVDVAAKAQTSRRAVASARVRMSREVLARIETGDAAKGDVLAAARLAGIQASKRTPELIPLCHSIALTRVEIAFALDVRAGIVDVKATAEAIDRTGVEMEALVAASVAALTIYDMVKSADRWMTIERVQLEEKSGGRSGSIRRP
jgi:cyclic pyranopterin phosphate synthase